MNITVKDSDLVGAGTQTVAVLSTTETTPETVTLTENPAGSGTFTGSFPTDPGPAVSGDGKLSVTNGDSITVRYVDVSSCGTPNVTVEKTTIGDCQAPSITNVQASGITESTATIAWTTNEPANSRVTYGTTIPPATVASDLATYGTTHSIALSGLPSCTAYRFGVSSADIAGNLATANAGGSYFAFSTKARAYLLGPDNVESGAGSWTASGTAGSIWHIDTCQAHSPTHAWKAGAPAGTCPGTYGAGVDTYLTSPTLGFGAAGHGYHLRFSELYKTQAGSDLCTPQVSTDGGTTWTNLDQYSGSNGAWAARDYDLSAYAGASVKVRFWFHSDASTNDEGWYVDDVEISRASACSADLLQQSDSVTDACASGGAGNGNGVLDPGEEAVVSVTVSNLGILPATGVTASLSTTTAGVSVTRRTATIPDIAVGATATTAAPHFAVSVAPSVPCGTLIDFTVVFTGNEGAWSSSFSVLVGQGGSGTTTYNSSDVPKTIQDNATITSTLTIPASGTITDVNAKLSLTHTFDGDLTLQLIAPSATTVLLSNRRGGSSDNYTNTIFDDQATTSITTASAPFTGSFKPEGALATLNGQAAAGAWQLSVQDSATADTGTLTSWSLIIAATTPPTCTSCTVVMPTETLSIGWPAGSKTKLKWGAVPGAGSYNLYRGDAAGLPALLNTGVDSCTAWTGSGTETPDTITQAPPAGGIHWFLVTAVNAVGEGTAGSATAGPRVVNSSGPCP
jgi:subtilisin-like proprotein convertase family protein